MDEQKAVTEKMKELDHAKREVLSAAYY